MPGYLLDLLAWTALFVVLFFVLRWLQNKRKNRNDDEA